MEANQREESLRPTRRRGGDRDRDWTMDRKGRRRTKGRVEMYVSRRNGKEDKVEDTRREERDQRRVVKRR